MKKTLLTFALAFTFAATAAMTGAPTVEYSADRSIQTKEGAFEQKLYSAPGKERTEFEQKGDKIISIMRMDKKLMWSCMPGEQKMCMEMALTGGQVRPDQDDDYRFELTSEGKETINGVVTDKSKLVIYDKKGAKLGGGFMWITPDKINVKTDYLMVTDEGKQMVKYELKNLKVGKQDPSLFELPKGFEVMNMSQMGFGGMMGGQGQRKGGGAQRGGEAGGNGMGDMMKGLGGMMKGMGR